MTEIGVEVPIRVENKPTLGSVEIPVGPNSVKVSWAEFKPANKESVDPTKAVLFLLGWPWQAKAKTTQDLPRWLANEFGQRSYSIDTQTATIDQNTLNLEAEGVRQFILSQGVKELTIFGHSEGAIRAANLTNLLEENNPDINIKGVVLANPMGFYPQNFTELAKNFVLVEIAQVEPKQINPRIPHWPQIKVLVELLQSFWQDMKAAKLKYPWMFAQQMKEMMRINSTLTKIKAPVLILTTDKDFVSNYRKYLPEEEIEKRSAKPVSEDEKYRSTERKANMAEARVEYTKENILPQAGLVKVLIASRFGSHIGLPVERYKQTAHVVSRIFDRLGRSAKK